MKYSVVAFLTAIAISGPALAQGAPGGSAFCQTFAADAARRGERAIKLNPACLDYTNGVHGNYRMHYDFCMSKPASQVQNYAVGIRALVAMCGRDTRLPPQAQPANRKGRLIVNRLSGKCIDVSGAPGTNNGAALLLWECERSGRNPNGSETDHRWTFTPQGFIKNTLSGKCIDVSGAPGTTNGARLILWDCETSGRNANGSPTDQQWELLPTGLIRNKLSGKCIDVSGAPGTRSGARLQLWDCESARNSDQYWWYED